MWLSSYELFIRNEGESDKMGLSSCTSKDDFISDHFWYASEFDG